MPDSHTQIKCKWTSWLSCLDKETAGAAAGARRAPCQRVYVLSWRIRIMVLLFQLPFL